MGLKGPLLKHIFHILTVQKKKKTYTFIDLFAGCGGLSEGFYRQGFTAVSHVEIDPIACETLRERMLHYGYKHPEREVIQHDITAEDIIERIDESLDGREVDIIIGGPPCQAYSTAGRARDKDGMKNDPRNYLFESYVRILNHYLPKVFVFENVTGILTACIKGNKIIDQVVAALSQNYNLISDPEKIVFNTANYGVPQVRKRVILMGVRRDVGIPVENLYSGVIKTHYDPDMAVEDRGTLSRYVTVDDAIGELPHLMPGGGEDEVPFEYTLGNDFLRRIGNSDNKVLYDHVCRRHNAQDMLRYREMALNHWTFEELLSNRPDLNHEHARLFGNSYVVQFGNLPARTIIAHLHKDGNQFIHPDPTQSRTITVREAARLQSFPDDFLFAGSRSDKYKQIGNAVPPLFAEALAKSICSNLDSSQE